MKKSQTFATISLTVSGKNPDSILQSLKGSILDRFGYAVSSVQTTNDSAVIHLTHEEYDQPEPDFSEVIDGNRYGQRKRRFRGHLFRQCRE